MADPGTLALVGMGASALGGVVGAVGAKAGAAVQQQGAQIQAQGARVAAGFESAGALYEGKATSDMYRFRAGIAQINKQISLQNADYARSVGEVEAQESGTKTRAVMGQTKAVQGASNLDANTGTAAAVRTSEYAVGAEDQAIIRSSAAKKAYGFEVEATEADLQSQQDTAASKTSLEAADIKSRAALAGGEFKAAAAGISGQAAGIAGDYGAASSILGGVSSVASKWMQYKSTFGGGGNPTSPGPYEPPISMVG